LPGGSGKVLFVRRSGRTVPLLAIATALLLAVATAPRPALGEGLAVYPCVASGFDLCLLQGRFRATLAWNDGSGARPAFMAQPRTDSASSAEARPQVEQVDRIANREVVRVPVRPADDLEVRPDEVGQFASAIKAVIGRLRTCVRN
jgi:hypothetical protein